MKVNVANLLKPISSDNPCGEDLESDSKFLGLEEMLQGQSEKMFDTTVEEPDWGGLVETSLELMARSKDLRVGLYLTLGLLRTEGFPGFCDGLLLLKGLIERYWDALYPKLDPTDNNDPTERVNTLASLTAAVGTFGDPMQFLARLRLAPLAESSRLGRVTMREIERSAGPTPADGTVMSGPQIEAAFRSTAPEQLREIHDAIVLSRKIVKEMDEFLSDAVGETRSINFERLEKTLRELERTTSRHVVPDDAGEESDSPASADAETNEAAGVAKGGNSAARVPGISGAIRSRQDVIRVLDQICEFYRRTEPSSPVPLLLQRARRLVDKDFVQLLTDLAPASLSQIHLVAGIRPDDAD